jgi:superfamily II DNA or RNA helicase
MKIKKIERIIKKPFTVSTWQSILPIIETKEGKLMVSEFDCIIVDEAHLAAGKSIQTISKCCINASYRFGFSGTYPTENTPDWFSIVGGFGPIKTFADYKHLQENGYIAQIKIFNLLLSYPKVDKLALYNTCGTDYQKQNDFIYGNKSRNNFILKMTQNITGNCLLLFTKKEKHGYIVKDLLEKELVGKKVIYIDGDAPVEEREDIRKIIENENNIVLIASYGILAAGWNVKNLHNIVFLSGYKSKVKVLQSIGRGLRIHKDKEFLKLYDLIDDFSFEDRKNSIRFSNHSFKHSKEREDLYTEQGWNFNTIKIKI